MAVEEPDEFTDIYYEAINGFAGSRGYQSGPVEQPAYITHVGILRTGKRARAVWPQCGRSRGICGEAHARFRNFAGEIQEG